MQPHRWNMVVVAVVEEIAPESTDVSDPLPHRCCPVKRPVLGHVIELIEELRPTTVVLLNILARHFCHSVLVPPGTEAVVAAPVNREGEGQRRTGYVTPASLRAKLTSTNARNVGSPAQLFDVITRDLAVA